MPDQLDRKVKTALDETRLLVLGIQVLLGFQFQAFFQNGFPQLAPHSKALCAAGLALQTLCLGLLIIPSMEHRLVERGSSSRRLIRGASFYTPAGFVPFSLSLGLAGDVVIERHFGTASGIAFGVGLALAAAFAWFGLEIFHREKAAMPDTSATPLTTKVEQVLTEARVIIPGAGLDLPLGVRPLLAVLRPLLKVGLELSLGHSSLPDFCSSRTITSSFLPKPTTCKVNDLPL